MRLREDDGPDIYLTVNYTASISDFFKSLKRGTNLMLRAVRLLIPLVGSIVLNGCHTTIFWARKDQDPAKIPGFDFNHFVTYLERGLWPFLVGLVVSIVIVPFFMIFMFMVMGGLAAFAGPDSHHESDG